MQPRPRKWSVGPGLSLAPEPRGLWAPNGALPQNPAVCISAMAHTPPSKGHPTRASSNFSAGPGRQVRLKRRRPMSSLPSGPAMAGRACQFCLQPQDSPASGTVLPAALRRLRCHLSFLAGPGDPGPRLHSPIGIGHQCNAQGHDCSSPQCWTRMQTFVISLSSEHWLTGKRKVQKGGRAPEKEQSPRNR